MEDRLPRNHARLALGAIAALTAAACIVAGARLWGFGVPGEWEWRIGARLTGFSAWILVAPVIAFLALAGIVAVALAAKLDRPRAAALAAAVFFAAWLLSATVGDLSPLGPYSAVMSTANPYAGGYYAAAVEAERRVPMSTWLREYPRFIDSLKVVGPMGHVADHPPGAIVLHWQMNRLMAAWPGLASWFAPDTEEQATLRQSTMQLAHMPVTRAEMAGLWAAAALFQFCAALCVVPLFFLARMFHGARVGILAAALAALIPSLHVFGPYPDQIFPLLAALMLLAFFQAWRRRSGAWAAACGVVLFIGLQFTLAFLAVAALAGIALLLLVFRAGDAPRPAAPRIALLLTCGVAGVLVPALLLRLAIGYDSFAVWTVCLRKHATFTQHFPRTYWKWLLVTPVEVAVFAGVPIACLFLGRLFDNRRAWLARGGGHPLDVLSWSLVILLVLLDLSGKNLGETARLWMVFMPFAAAAAARLLADRFPHPQRAALWTMGLAFMQLVCFCSWFDMFTP